MVERDSNQSTPSTSLVVGIILIVLAVLIAFGVVIFVVQRRRKRYEHLFRRKQTPNRNETDDTLMFVEPRRREGSVRVDGDEEWGTFDESMEEVRRPSRMTAAPSPSLPSNQVNQTRHRNHDNSDPKDEETGEEYDPLVYYSTSKPGHANETGEYEKDDDNDDHLQTPLLSPSVPRPQSKQLPAIPPPTPTPINHPPTSQESSSATKKDTIMPTPSHTSSQPSVITLKREHTDSSSSSAPPRPPLPPIPSSTGDESSHLQRTTTEVVSTLLKSRATNVRKETNGSVEHIERAGSIVNYSGRGGKVGGSGNVNGRSVRFALPPPPLPPLPPLPPPRLPPPPLPPLPPPCLPPPPLPPLPPPLLTLPTTQE